MLEKKVYSALNAKMIRNKVFFKSKTTFGVKESTFRTNTSI
jgi:hypothetical protein